MKKIKLLVDAHVFDNGFQGTTSFIQGIYNELVKKEDIKIHLAARDVQQLKYFFPDPRFQMIPLKSASRFQRLLLEYPSVIKKYGIDYAHFQYIVPPVKRCQYIVTIHDLLFKDFLSEFPLAYRTQKDMLFRRAARQADVLTTVSEYSAKAIERHYKIAGEKIVLTPNAVSREYFQPHDKAQSNTHVASKFGIENFLLYVARVEPRKNHELLIRAFRDLRLYEQNMNLVFIGQKAISSSKLESLLKEMSPQILQRIHWLEKISPGDLLHFYNAAKVFVYPSKAEGFGIPPLEAAALRTPALCSSATAMGDFTFFDDHLFDPNNEIAFKKKLQELLAHQPAEDQLAAISKIIAWKYDWGKSADNLYKALVKKCE